MARSFPIRTLPVALLLFVLVGCSTAGGRQGSNGAHIADSSLSAATPITGGAAGYTPLPLAAELVSLTSDAGERLLFESDARKPYLPLTAHFVTQKNQAYCGVASMVMVLNALDIPAPETKEYAPFRQFTQDNLLNDATERILPQAVIARQGMTLDELGAVLATYGVATAVQHASDVTPAVFRSEAVAALGTPGQHVLVNYLRKALGQEKGGHISPLAAYDKETDRFLILDVSRYKYPPVWVKADQLHAAMNTPDSDNRNRSRGYVVVRKMP